MPPHETPPPPSGMWGTIAAISTSENAIFILGTVVAIAIIFGVFVKLRIIRIRHKAFNAGEDYGLLERIILRKQLEYVQKYCLALAKPLSKVFGGYAKATCEDCDGKCPAKEYYYRWLASLVSNEFEKWVMVNSISNDSDFIKAKTVELKAYLVSLVGDCAYDERELDELMSRCVREIVEHLALIRKSSGNLG